MARKDALIRLHQRLISKRETLRKKLFDEFKLTKPVTDGVGDVGDVACDGASTELDSQLAALESRELRQVERAIELIREGRYGICEHCEQSIPVTRLQAVPFAPLCVECQRLLEESGELGEEFDADWENAYEFEGRLNDKEYTLRDLDIGE
jgi:DnaK suppressor protein